jgi:hypothetical protein
MNEADEFFTMQLGRAAGRQAARFLKNRKVARPDRDDIISAALLWCWENRANYSLTTTLETWFMNAVRDAYKNFKNDELPSSDESIDTLTGGSEDPTYDTVAAESSAKALLLALTPADRTVALKIMQGFTRKEMMAQGVPHDAIYNARARIKQLQRLIPERTRSKRLLQSTAAVPPPDDGGAVSAIDTELEQLEFAPAAGKDCPPCWRCMWFEGFMPAGKRETRMDIEDTTVREAVKNTEVRKIEIAQQVRSGL